MKIPLSQIIIGDRQRQDMGDISELADSIRRLGQIHSIGVRAEDNMLIWGMRRFLACKRLGMWEIEATVRTGLTEEMAQEIELEEDIKRKNRSWQEECMAVAKLYRLKGRQARAEGKAWNIREMAAYSGLQKTTIAEYVFTMDDALRKEPRDNELWAAINYTTAIGILRTRAEYEAQMELEKRRQLAPVTIGLHPKPLEGLSRPVQETDNTPQATPKPTVGMLGLGLSTRAMLYNKQYEHLGPPNTPLFYINKNNREFIHGFWFVGGGNISDLYGSYQIEYLNRIETLFPDATQTIHLFVGSLPPSDKYLRVGLPQGDTKPDIECDAHYLSSKLPFKPDLIYADPPYSVEDSEHYQNSMVNRDRVIQECAIVLQPGGFLVWLDQALPLFSNNDLQLVGAIAYIRSTGNRFRVVSIFRKPLQQSCPPNTTSSQASTTTK